MSRPPWRRLPAPGAWLLLLCMVGAPAPALGAGDPAAVLRQALDAACEQPVPEPARMAQRIPGAAALSSEAMTAQGMVIGWTRRFGLPDGAEIEIERLAPGGRLRRLTVAYSEPAPDGGHRPAVALVAGADCAVRLGRRLVYEAGSARPIALEHLDRELSPTGRREPLNPPVPAGVDPGGIPVALVDAGVNYLLPGIRERLARGRNGEILGYDYWDMDRRPFDANPARSPFFPQRHGTRTASLLLREAPAARLVPYRYPRPDMSRMTRLLSDAERHRVRIVNLSLGGNDPREWQAFAEAARAHPGMLFVISAGNNGRDIDAAPVYPASLALDNAVVVTSSEPNGELARGSNWGGRSVDLLVPAERLLVTGFDGGETVVSGSSYAAVRISALAARLLARHPGWRAAELKAAILARILPPEISRHPEVRHGFMPRPDKAEQLPVLSAGGEPRQTARYTLEDGGPYPPSDPPLRRLVLEPTFAYFEGGTWQKDALRRHARQVAAILARCGIVMPAVDVRVLDGPEVYRYFQDAIARDLVDRLELPKPTVYFVRDTLQVDAYDAEAVGKANSATRPALRYTVWLTEATRDPGIALAHELAHVLMDSGRHTDRPGNLMRAETSPDNTGLTEKQCEAMRRAGTANALLGAADEP